MNSGPPSIRQPYKLEARILSGTRFAIAAIFEDSLLAGCAAQRTPTSLTDDHWSVRCLGGKHGTQTTLSSYAKARRHMITPR
jgi:hypothetical protein